MPIQLQLQAYPYPLIRYLSLLRNRMPFTESLWIGAKIHPILALLLLAQLHRHPRVPANHRYHRRPRILFILQPLRSMEMFASHRW